MEDRTATLIAGQIGSLRAEIDENLQRSEDRMATLIAGQTGSLRAEIDENLRRSEDRMATLIAGEIGNLHTEIKESEARLSARLESISARLTLQGGLIQSGSRAITRFSSFAENSEERWIDLLGRVEFLDERVRRLEQK